MGTDMNRTPSFANLPAIARRLVLSTFLLSCAVGLSGCASLIPQSQKFADVSHDALKDLTTRLRQSDDAVSRALAANWLLIDGNKMVYSPNFRTSWAEARKAAGALADTACAPLRSDRAADRHAMILSSVTEPIRTLAETDPDTLGSTLKALLANSRARFDAPNADQALNEARKACFDSFSTLIDPQDIPIDRQTMSIGSRALVQGASESLSELTTYLKVIERNQRSLALRRVAMQAQSHNRVKAALQELPSAALAHAQRAEPILLVEAHLALSQARQAQHLTAAQADAARQAVEALKRFQSSRVVVIAQITEKLVEAFDRYFKHAESYGNSDGAALLDSLIQALEDLDALLGD